MDIAKMIDHTILKPEAKEDQVIKICDEAKKYGFASVCVNGCYTSLVKENLAGTDVKVCVVVGFPLGAAISEVKAFETKKAVEEGAQEIDMVINVGAMKEGKYDYVQSDIGAVVRAAGDAHVKVILETCLLTHEEIVKACELSKAAGAQFVKTSTGFNKEGATVEAVELMRKTVGEDMGVKAAGGIRSREKALNMIKAGADRIGASASIKIVEG